MIAIAIIVIAVEYCYCYILLQKSEGRGCDIEEVEKLRRLSSREAGWKLSMVEYFEKNEAQERVEITEEGRQNQNHEIPKARAARSGKRAEGLALHIGEDSFGFFFLLLFSPLSPPPPDMVSPCSLTVLEFIM